MGWKIVKKYSKQFQILAIFSFFAGAESLSSFCVELQKELQTQQEAHQRALQKQKELEAQFKNVLKAEILAQVENRDRAVEQEEAKRVYYDVRRIRAEVERVDLEVSRIRQIYCPKCPSGPGC